MQAVLGPNGPFILPSWRDAFSSVTLVECCSPRIGTVILIYIANLQGFITLP